jgi:integrase
MPLSLTRRKGSGVWQIVGTVAGQRVRQSAGTADRRLADEIRSEIESKLVHGKIFGAKAVITWEQACSSYLDVNPPSVGTAALLARLTAHIGPGRKLRDIDQSAVDRACIALCRPEAAPGTKLRNVITPLRAVLTHSARRGWCDLPAIETPKGASGVKRTRWLTPDEFTRLRDAAAPHLRPLIVFMVCTGARVGSEALELRWSDVDLEHARALLRDTKNGRDRLVDLPPAAIAALSAMPGREGNPQAVVFPRHDGIAYAEREGAGGQVKTAWATARRGAALGSDVTPHTLRHTWATWHYALHRDLLRLKADGDWSSVSLVERYAKLAPETMAPGIRAAWGVLGKISVRAIQ